MKANIFKVSMITSLFFRSFIFSAISVRADINEIGIRPGDRYGWTMTEMDEEVFEDLKGYYYPIKRPLKSF